jgi:hypothetical protein
VRRVRELNQIYSESTVVEYIRNFNSNFSQLYNSYYPIENHTFCVRVMYYFLVFIPHVALNKLDLERLRKFPSDDLWEASVMSRLSQHVFYNYFIYSVKGVHAIDISDCNRIYTVKVTDM